MTGLTGAAILIAALIALALLALGYRAQRDDLAAWIILFSRKIHDKDKTPDEIVRELKEFVIDESDL